jgi:hypothetical protein
MSEQPRKISDLYSKISNDPKYNPKNSWKWFDDQVKSLFNQSSASMYDVLGQDLKRQSNSVDIGSMYFFTYDPIGKDTLPYYDNFPLIFPISSSGKYFTGINLHYLEPKMRFELLNKLMEISGSPATDSKTKLKLNWKLLNNAAKFPGIMHCVKKYHIGHVKSRFMCVDPNNWVMAVMLPCEKFKGASTSEIWKIGRG